MNYREISPGIIQVENDMDLLLVDSEEEEYPPNHYLAFDKTDFETYLHFIIFLKSKISAIKKISPDDISVTQTISENGMNEDYYRIRFKEFILNLKIPQKSDILNIEREYLVCSIWKSGHCLQSDQPIFKFENLYFRLRSLI